MSPLGPLACFALSLVILYGLLLPATRRWFLDHPNPRSLHHSPVPRTGGLAIVVGFLVSTSLTSNNLPVAVMVPFAGLAVLSLWDDWRGLPAGVRLVGHLAAAAVFVSLSVSHVNALTLVALVFAVGWMTNLYNFMDGADGLAGGMTLVGFTAYAVGAAMAGDMPFALINLCVVGCAGAFLIFNFPPARIFMGDTGSVPLGFLAGAFGILGWQTGLWPLWFPGIVFSPFIVDATVTLLRRALRGDKVWQAHRSHYYQRLVILGWSHRQLARAEYLLMVVSAVAALAAITRPPAVQGLILGAVLVAYIMAGLAVDRRWRARVPG